MADDTKRAYASSARGEPAAGWDEPNLGGGAQHESVGERLRRERETYGLYLREVSESLRIRYAYLDAIERSAFDELPGPTYAVGFVRGYAQFLGLDDDRIVQRFKEESQGLKRDQELYFPEPVNEGKLPGKTILVLSILLIGAAYGAWAYLSDADHSIAELVPKVPESLQRMVGATEAPPVPDPTDLSSPSPDANPTTDAPATGTGQQTAGDGSGDLAGEQVAELPETESDPDLAGGGTSSAGAGEPSGTTDTPSDDTLTGGAPAPDADQAAPEVPETSGVETGGAEPVGTQTGDRVSPDAPTTENASQPTATGDAGGGIPEAPAANDRSASTRETGSAMQAAETDTPDAPTGGNASAGDVGDSGTNPAQSAQTGNGAETSDGAEANPAPPAVPEIQQDDSGIPSAPQQTQTATAQDTGVQDTGARDPGSGTDGRSFGASPANSRVTLVATARCWVQVRGPDDSLVLTRLLRPGDRYNVPDRPGLTLHTGNAGGLQVMVGGREVGRLGGDGEVRRGVLLEPQALTAGG